MAHKILVTGAGGYIGSVAVYLFLQSGYEVVAVDDFCTGYRQPLAFFTERFKGRFKYYEIDLKTNKIDDVFKEEENIEAVVHYAASCIVDESMKNPGKYFSNNVGGTNNLLSAMAYAGVKNIVFSSTCAVYGEAQYMPLDEKHPLNPTTPYGASKKMVEEIIDWYKKRKGLRYMVLRYFNVCGASDDGLIGDSKKPSTLLVQNAVRGALGIEPFKLTCPEVPTPDRTPIRDYINVVDLNDAHMKAIELLIKGAESNIINLGTGTGNSVLEIVKEVQSVTGVKFDIGKTIPREGDDAKKIANIDKAKDILGWEPKKTISDSVKSLVTWYKAHPHGWQS
ncbi:UDP-glucose 4-epimerase GalE [Candidatus Roizmanbacteria bacterium RIFOXYB2_FULL_38_10]|uniref:UDP-glucose 4-epimerase n=1 Tax=Candidatus Roizmanbacteria bacterium RIFOXYD1_FULL_38_12 TaxID=1802093 RepID=A0A1F7L0Z7_9BACT|nr:MAG: UDP-glucose 4-epimerase GalE [Candidatus Roizmanbacteria bacterium RIFOXYA2_FULL_38_14]OGK63776.1 MAG: UDP-glucose 4-epimerase GalE [Candidatus Roizmanbacteria bacterium RIFOXYA1_FULL_37_12]OGK65622.1 MAG: UDP-glucose 4-epimerase GalE [Candidatus Roizmanbacteria bacterium RIFOXYB1_FULL_40_23]OGK67490.1 MAG: UDP-glucose 4-epimerase GalE [Candidatus Roizmanbacteria bacterium RIFOXYB2_FULL_38_10]OGK70027.1 MAG: UDP-glucose 4-epimerase GalE [Candidatus Roizmanbacteria bacterium RIFOXYC1_FUL